MLGTLHYKRIARLGDSGNCQPCHRITLPCVFFNTAECFLLVICKFDRKVRPT